MATTTGKQSLLDIDKGVESTTDKGEALKNATARSSNVPTGGLRIGTTWKVYCVDALNICVSRRRASKDGKESWQIEGFFSTVGAALHYLVEKGVKETGLKDLQTVVDKVEALTRDITEAINGL